MTQKVIKFIVSNAREKLALIAIEQNLNENFLYHLANKFLAENNTNTMSAYEVEFFNLWLKPLIDSGFCDGALAYIKHHEKCSGKLFMSDNSICRCTMDGKCICHIL